MRLTVSSSEGRCNDTGLQSRDAVPIDFLECQPTHNIVRLVWRGMPALSPRSFALLTFAVVACGVGYLGLTDALTVPVFGAAVCVGVAVILAYDLGVTAGREMAE